MKRRNDVTLNNLLNLRLKLTLDDSDDEDQIALVKDAEKQYEEILSVFKAFTSNDAEYRQNILNEFYQISTNHKNNDLIEVCFFIIIQTQNNGLIDSTMLILAAFNKLSLLGNIAYVEALAEQVYKNPNFVMDDIDCLTKDKQDKARSNLQEYFEVTSGYRQKVMSCLMQCVSGNYESFVEKGHFFITVLERMGRLEAFKLAYAEASSPTRQSFLNDPQTLFVASGLRVVEFLFDEGVNAGGVDNAGNTVLHHWSANGLLPRFLKTHPFVNKLAAALPPELWSKVNNKGETVPHAFLLGSNRTVGGEPVKPDFKSYNELVSTVLDNHLRKTIPDASFPECIIVVIEDYLMSSRVVVADAAGQETTVIRSPKIKLQDVFAYTGIDLEHVLYYNTNLLMHIVFRLDYVLKSVEVNNLVALVTQYIEEVPNANLTSYKVRLSVVDMLLSRWDKRAKDPQLDQIQKQLLTLFVNEGFEPIKHYQRLGLHPEQCKDHVDTAFEALVSKLPVNVIGIVLSYDPASFIFPSTEILGSSETVIEVMEASSSL